MPAEPVSVDLRTRLDRDVKPVEASTFFDQTLPALLSARAGLVETAVRTLVPVPLRFEIGSESWTLVPEGGGIVVGRGQQLPAGEWQLTDEQLSELVLDRLTPMGLYSSGKLALKSLSLHDALDWWLVLRSVLDQRPLHRPGSVSFVDQDDRRLDLRRSFQLTDRAGDLAWFLGQAGYLHLVGVFTEDEMAVISGDMDRAAPGYAPSDGRSWWARTADGRHHLVRMQGFDQHSPTTAALLGDARLQRIADLTGDGHQRNTESDNAIEALFKPIGVVEGISDVPWHKDCGLGRHSYDCCSLTIGISVTGADGDSGQLRVIAGSHRALVWPALRQPGLDLPEVELPTRTGDVTVHLSCTLHMAQPPVTRERRVLYAGLRLPPRDAAAVEARRRLTKGVREAAPRTVSQPPSVAPKGL